jgi:hypothetical protein
MWNLNFWGPVELAHPPNIVNDILHYPVKIRIILQEVEEIFSALQETLKCPICSNWHKVPVVRIVSHILMMEMLSSL